MIKIKPIIDSMDVLIKDAHCLDILSSGMPDTAENKQAVKIMTIHLMNQAGKIQRLLGREADSIITS